MERPIVLRLTMAEADVLQLQLAISSLVALAPVQARLDRMLSKRKEV